MTDDEALAALAESGMTGQDAVTALSAWRAAGPDHPDSRRVQACLAASGLV